MSSLKPHRRMSLTQPSVEVAPSVSIAETNAVGTIAETSTEPTTELTAELTAEPAVRVMAYLDPNEADILDNIWVKVRRLPSRPSKSDILRAALLFAANKEEEFSSILSQQQNSTLSRQRISKLKRK